MSAISDFLRKAGVFFLATSEQDTPHLRPLGLFMEDSGRIYYSVGDFKAVYRQLISNPRCQIVALDKEMNWIRISGKAHFEKRPDLEARALEAEPYLKDVYNARTGYHMAFFYLEDERALLMDLMGNIHEI